MQYCLKFSFLSSKNGNIKNKEVFKTEYGTKEPTTMFGGPVIGIYTGEIKDGEINGKGKLIVYGINYHDGKSLISGDFNGIRGDKSDFIVYEGDWISGEFTGYGKKTDGKKILEGLWHNDILIEGQSTQGDRIGTWKNGKFSGYLYSDTYTGNIKDDKYDGSGKCSWANGDIYVGEWKDGFITGKGKYSWGNGEVYEGGWEANIRNGKGKMTYLDGKIYEGDFKNNERSGNGKCIYSKHTEFRQYEGDWGNDRLEGKGKLFYINGDVYEGDFKAGQKHGIGKMLYKNEDIYEGSWLDGKRNGKGKFMWKDGSIYDGVWKDDKKCGYGIGIMIYSNGNYEGELKDDIRNGKGKYVWKDGSIYEGEWKDGKKWGNGKMIYKRGDVYEGEFKNSFRDGSGKMIFANGDAFEGEWKEDRKKGNGKMIFEGGNIWEGVWGEDNAITGKIIWRSCSHVYYEGEWLDDILGVNEGRGKLIYTNGSFYEGDVFLTSAEGKGIFHDKIQNIIVAGFWQNGQSVNKKANLLIQEKKFTEAIEIWKEYERTLLFEEYEAEINGEISKILPMQMDDALNANDNKKENENNGFEDFE